MSLNDLSDALAPLGVDLDDLRAAIPNGDDAECVFLVGSLAERLSTKCSDIDLIVVERAEPLPRGGTWFREGAYDGSLNRLPSGHELQIDYWSQSKLLDFGERLGAMLRGITTPDSVKKIERFSEVEMNMFHRIRVGVPIVRPEAAAGVRGRMLSDFFPDYKVLWSIMLHSSFREDAVAHVDVGDQLSALTMIRLSADQVAGAALASVGETNMYPKWRPRLLSRNVDDLGKDTVERLLEFLFPSRDQDAETSLQEFETTADEVIDQVLQRRPPLRSAVAELNSRVKFVRYLHELRGAH